MCECLSKISSCDIKKILQEEERRKYSLLSNYISNLKGSNTQQRLPSNSCMWVPAALHNTENESKLCLCYGGELICPKIKPSPLSVYHKSVFVSVNPHDIRTYPRKSQCIRTDATKLSNSRRTSQ